MKRGAPGLHDNDHPDKANANGQHPMNAHLFLQDRDREERHHDGSGKHDRRRHRDRQILERGKVHRRADKQKGRPHRLPIRGIGP